ncbi:MAG TPA: hypothetical protein PKO06_10180, partial [Candidatus Ozemobacteraceae bacterium]|nr:hypothetical protein [Candidatus Ozemobacteraceae bacterium]
MNTFHDTNRTRCRPTHLRVVLVWGLFLISAWPIHGATLAELIDAALSRNLGIKRATLQVESARIDEQKARNALIPNLDADLSD